MDICALCFQSVDKDKHTSLHLAGKVGGDFYSSEVEVYVCTKEAPRGGNGEV